MKEIEHIPEQFEPKLFVVQILQIPPDVPNVQPGLQLQVPFPFIPSKQVPFPQVEHFWQVAPK